MPFFTRSRLGSLSKKPCPLNGIFRPLGKAYFGYKFSLFPFSAFCTQLKMPVQAGIRGNGRPLPPVRDRFKSKTHGKVPGLAPKGACFLLLHSLFLDFP